MKTVFVVDDNNVNLLAAENTLSERYNVFTLSSAANMFELLEDVTPDLILLDIAMPSVNGLDTLRLLKDNAKYAEIPVIFLTANIDNEVEALGIEMGAIDFITKPFSVSVLLNRIHRHLEIEGIIRERTDMLRQRTERLLKLQNGMVSVLANMVENRDKLTSRHNERTTGYIRVLLNAMVKRGVYIDEIQGWCSDGASDFEVVISSARLHDIGKIIVTDLILNKPDKLTDAEYEIMKTHAAEGERIIESIIAESGGEVFLHNAKLFAGSHHERWDGKGYPRGLKGAEIPLQGRIMAIADVYDALINERPYKKAMPHESAVEIIKESRGTQFDPRLVDVFLEVSDLFLAVNTL
ncbi:MAG: response regulator [Oscillospiraceae bacterium]|nr:response regulator [Oscillospiraceae bacterium]